MLNFNPLSVTRITGSLSKNEQCRLKNVQQNWKVNSFVLISKKNQKKNIEKGLGDVHETNMHKLKVLLEINVHKSGPNQKKSKIIMNH